MKKIIFLTVLAGLLGCTLHAQNTSENNNHIKSVKAFRTGCSNSDVLHILKHSQQTAKKAFKSF